jgi:tetratricopeptide (TPR) repeat protein
MPSPLLLALRAHGAGAAGGGSERRASSTLSRCFLLYRQEQAFVLRAPSSSSSSGALPLGLAGGDQRDRGQQQQPALPLRLHHHHDHQYRTFFSFPRKTRDGRSAETASAAPTAAPPLSGEEEEQHSLLDAAFEGLPRIFRPGAAAEQAVHDLGGLPAALADLLGGASSSSSAAAAAASASLLPWAASLPLATLALKVALTPLSLRSAAVVRSNVRLWTEAAGLAEQRAAKAAHRQRQQDEEEAAASREGVGGGNNNTQQAPELASTRVAVYSELRRQCGVPSPLWALGNMAVQVPTFFYVAASVRAMAGFGDEGGGGGEGDGGGGGGEDGNTSAPLAAAYLARPAWPGFQTEGALWFRDLSLPAAVAYDPATPAAAATDLCSSWLLHPLGLQLASAAAAAAPAAAAGSGAAASSWALFLSSSPAASAMALPLFTTALSLMAIRRGVAALGGAKALALLPGLSSPSGGGSAGAAAAVAAASPLLRGALAALPALAYTLAASALYFKVQAPAAVLLHWCASLGYTLALQRAAARSPLVRRAMGLPPLQTTQPPPPPPPTTTTAPSSSPSFPSSAAPSPQSPAAVPNTAAHQEEQQPPPPLPEGAEPEPEPEPPEVLTPQQFLARARADLSERQPDVLVVMAAHHSSRGDTLSARYCLDLALKAEPAHARARYARGQARSMAGDWHGAEEDYVAAAGALEAAAGAEAGEEHEEQAGGGDRTTARLLRGQALYAAGGAAAGSGRHARALELFDESARWWRPAAAAEAGGSSSSGNSGRRAAAARGGGSTTATPVAAAAAAASAQHAPALLALARSRSLAALDRPREALDALDRALSAGQRDSVTTAGLRALLEDARSRIAGGGGGGGG